MVRFSASGSFTLPNMFSGSTGLSTGLIAAIVVGSLVGAVLLCCWVGSIIECVQHVYKYWCSCCHRHPDPSDFHVTTVLGNPTADPSTVIVAGRLPPSYSSIFHQAETSETFRNDSAFRQDVTPSTSFGAGFRSYQNGVGSRSHDLYQCSTRSELRESFCDSPAHRSGTMESIHCSLASRSGTMEAIHCSPKHRSRMMETSHCQSPASRSGTMDSIHCSPAHRSTTMESIHSATPRSGTMESIHFSPSHRARLLEGCSQSVHCSPTHRPRMTDAQCSPAHRPIIPADAINYSPSHIHCSPTHRSVLSDSVHCSPTHRPEMSDSIPCSLIMDVNNYSPRHRRKFREAHCMHGGRMWDPPDAVHYIPSHRYGPVDILNFSPITMTDNMITVHCPQQSNISNMPDITENLHEQSPEHCSPSRLSRDGLDSCDSNPEPRNTVVHTCKTANAAVQVDLIPQSFYEDRSSIRWC